MAAVVTMTLGAAMGDARAFNSGGHFEATKRALDAKGFSRDAVRLARAANFYADFTSELPSKLIDIILPILEGSAVLLPFFVPAAALPATGAVIAIESLRQYLATMKHHAQYFHVLGLRDARTIAHDLTWLENAGKKYAREARDASDPERLLITMGLVFHAIQDLYTHSNMPDLDWNRWVGQPFATFDELPEDIWGNPKFTLPRGNEPPRKLVGAFSPPDRHGAHTNSREWPRHGKGHMECPTYPDGVECGMNHDSAKRNRHLNAVMMAWRASEIWIEKFKSWVGNERFWQRAQSYSNSDEARECEDWARALSIGSHSFGWSKEPWDSKAIAAFAVSGWGCMDLRGKMSDVLVKLYENDDTAPLRCDGNAAARRNCWVSKFGDASRRDRLVGTFDATWGNEQGTLRVTLRDADAAQLDGEFRAGNRVWKLRGDVHGDRWDFRRCETNHCPANSPGNNEGTGVLYDAGHGSAPKSMAGFMRDGSGVPNGFFAVVR